MITFSKLQNQLADLVGAQSIDQLPPNEQETVRMAINEAYRECFVTPQGSRPPWSEQDISFILPAPVTGTVELAHGEKGIGSPSFEDQLKPEYAGAVLKIGTLFYTYAGKDNDGHKLVEPWQGESGTRSVQVFFPSYLLPVEAISVTDPPEVIGWGPLAPMSGRAQELRHRSIANYDFYPAPGAGFGVTSRWHHHSDMQFGDPLFYYIDAACLAPEYTPRYRFRVYPLPDGKARTVIVRANIVPKPLAGGADVPKLPGGLAEDILLPIARAKVVAISRRYNGTNRGEILAMGERAAAKLETLRSPQKRTRGRIRIKPGFG